MGQCAVIMIMLACILNLIDIMNITTNSLMKISFSIVAVIGVVVNVCGITWKSNYKKHTKDFYSPLGIACIIFWAITISIAYACM